MSSSRARWATRAQFLHLGVIAGVWGVHVPSIKAAYGLDARWLALVLLATSAGSVAMLFLAGPLVGRLGVRTVTVLAGWTFCGALMLSLRLPGVAALVMVTLLLGAGESLYDVAINAEGTVLEQLGGRAVMSGFHGMFSLGALIGSAAAAAMIAAGVPAPTQELAVGGAVALSIAVASRGMLAVHPAAEPSQRHSVRPRGVLLLTGLLICAAMLAEGVMYNWSVLYVQQELAAPQQRAALAYAAFAGATALMRFGGDRLRARVPERTIVAGGALLAAGAMAVVLLARQVTVALVGFAVVGAGLATVVPILYNAAATRVPGVTRAAAIASVSSIGYVGFMIGPPIIGGLAQATSLTVAMATLIVAALILPLGATRVPLAGRVGYTAP